MYNIIVIFEGLRIFSKHLKRTIFGMKKYKGNAEEIVSKIIEKVWNGKYYMVSNGHFKQFYSRDFGWCTKSLINLGHSERVKKTLDYALSKFKKGGHIRVAINPYGKPFDFPTYAPDSLAFILNSLRILNDKALVEKYKTFLNSEIMYFFKKVVDKKTGLPKPDHFSSMKDYSIRKSSCYDLVMCYMVQKNAHFLGLKNPLKKYNYRKLIMKYYWANDYLLDDLSGKTYLSGDAQILPLWSGLIKDKKIFLKIKQKIKNEYLDHPLPMKYTNHHNKEIDLISISILNKDYESHVPWAHMGMLWLEVLEKYDRKELRLQLENYKKVIEKYKNFLEVYNNDLSLFRNLIYTTDESMSWSSVWLYLWKKYGKN